MGNSPAADVESALRLDVYLLKDRDDKACGEFTAKLTAKVWRSGLKTVIVCRDQAHAKQLDELLWRVPPDAFLPHHLITEGPDVRAILLTFPGAPCPDADCVIFTTAQGVDVAALTTRVALVIPDDDAARQQSRVLYRELQQRGYNAQIHDLRAR